MEIETISSRDAPPGIGPYSQAVRAGGFIFCSGVAGFDPKTNTYLVLNPSSHRSDMFTYEQLVLGDAPRSWHWIETWSHPSFRPDGCNPRFRSCSR